MSKQDYVDYLKIWFPRNKAKGMISQILFEEEFESGFLKKHAVNFNFGYLSKNTFRYWDKQRKRDVMRGMFVLHTATIPSDVQQYVTRNFL